MGTSLKLLVRTLSVAIAIWGVHLPGNKAQAGGLVLAHAYPEGSATDQWAREFGQCAQERTGQYVEIVPDRLVGEPLEIAARVVHGDMDMAILPAWAANEFWPGAKALTLPGVMTNSNTVLNWSNNADVLQAIQEGLDEYRSVSVVALGWQYGLLVGGARSMQGWQGLQGFDGARVASYSSEVSAMLNELGAEPVEYSWYDSLSALEWGELDGLFVPAEWADRLVTDGIAGSIYYTENFVPFKEAQLVVFGGEAAEVFGSELIEELRSECGFVSDKYNGQQIEQMQRLVERASRAGVKILPLGTGDESRWNRAFDAALKIMTDSSAVGGDILHMLSELKEITQ